MSVSASLYVLSRVRLCDPMDCSLPGSSVHGIFQARILERVPISYSRVSSRSRNRAASLVSPALAGFLTTARPGKPLQPQLEVNGGQTLALDSLCVCSSALGTMVTGGSNPVLIPSLFPPLLHHPSTHIHFAPALSWVLVMVLCGREVSAFHVGRMSTAP